MEMISAKIEQVLQGRFQEMCQSFGRNDLCQQLKERLKGSSETGKEFINELIMRLRGTREGELLSYLCETLQLPIGLGLKLKELLQSIDCWDTLQSYKDFSLLTQLSLDPAVAGLIEEWKEGSLNFTEVISALHNQLASSLSDAQQCALIVGELLRESGHSNQNLSSPLYAESLCCEVDEIQQVIPRVVDGRILIRCINGAIIRVPFNLNGSWDVIPSQEYLPVTSCDAIRWRFVAVQRGLTAFTTTQCIEIGGSIEWGKGIIDVGFVATVDVLASGARDWRQVVIIVHGRWQAPSEDGSVQACDGLTDVCRYEDNSQSPNESGLEMDQRFMPDYDHSAQYFVILASWWSVFVKIHDVIGLFDVIEPDQAAVKATYAQDGLVFLQGSHGLLGCLSATKPAASIRSHWIFQPLVTDDFDLDQAPCTPSHSSEAVIVAIDYQAQCDALLSADSQGALCLWTRASDQMPFHLASRPHLVRRASSISAVYLSSTGEFAVVALSDRLLLLKLVELLSRSPGSNSVQERMVSFYEKGVLDIVERVSAKYAVAFGQQVLELWRVTPRKGPAAAAAADETCSRKGITVSHWTHPNVDSVEFQLSTRIADQWTASSLAFKELCSEIDHNSLPASQRPLGRSKIEQKKGFMLVGGNMLPVHRPTVLDMSSLKRFEASARPSSADAGHVVTEKDYRTWLPFLQLMRAAFLRDCSTSFIRAKRLLALLAASSQPLSLGMLSAALDSANEDVEQMISYHLSLLVRIVDRDTRCVVQFTEQFQPLASWLCSKSPSRIGGLFWIDVAEGHNLLCALYLKLTGNKSVAVEHTWQNYLQTYGPLHLRRCSRGLRQLTSQVRKLDETANIRGNLPHQIGYISGLQEIYARRVGLGGRIPKQLGSLAHLRVLSMGNNRLSGPLPASLGQLKHLQRIVLHQNNLQGAVPEVLGELGCIVNLAGNPRLEYGPDVPAAERDALIDLFLATRGPRWSAKTNWNSSKPVSKWYKVGVLSSHVHSLVMSSNGMEGGLPESMGQLTSLRMIELATMSGLVGPLPKALCRLTSLRRLCICRCELNGRIPAEIGNLVSLEELQLFGNKLSGSIPQSLGRLVNLRLLSLGEYTGGNNFSAEPLPACIANLRNLEALFMANCNLRGPLPAWIGDLTGRPSPAAHRHVLSIDAA
jgi:hypothetical protein